MADTLVRLEAGQVVPPLTDLLTGHHFSSSSSDTFPIRGGIDRPQSLFYLVPQPSRIGLGGRTKVQKGFAIIWEFISSEGFIDVVPAICTGFKIPPLFPSMGLAAGAKNKSVFTTMWFSQWWSGMVSL